MSGIISWVIKSGTNGFTLGGVISAFAHALPKYLSADSPIERSDDIGINVRLYMNPDHKPTGVQRNAVIALWETWRREVFEKIGIECVEYRAGEVVLVEAGRGGTDYVGYVVRDSADVAHICRLDKHGNVQHMTLSPHMANFAVHKDLPYSGEKGAVLAGFKHWNYALDPFYLHCVRRHATVIAAHREDQAFIRSLVTVRLQGLRQDAWLMEYVDDPALAFELLTDEKFRGAINDDHRSILVEKVNVADIPELFRQRRITFTPVAVKALRRLDQATITELFRKNCGAGEGNLKSYTDALDPDTARTLYDEGLGVYAGSRPYTDHDFRKRLAARFATD